jgi:hypothetical protein
MEEAAKALVFAAGHGVGRPLTPVERLAHAGRDRCDLDIAGLAGERAEHPIVGDKDMPQVSLGLDVRLNGGK